MNLPLFRWLCVQLSTPFLFVDLVDLAVFFALGYPQTAGRHSVELNKQPLLHIPSPILQPR